jgi:hypothetical protein
MQSNEEAIYQAIKCHFSCDKRPHRRTGIKFLALLIVSLLKLADSSLAQWALGINSSTKRSSRFRRVQRFIGQFRFSARLYAQVVWLRYGQGKHVVLTLDRTQYQQGSEWIQFLVLGIAYQRISIPLIWTSANREGNCTLIARKAVLKRLTDWIEPRADQRIYLTADREFVGPEFRTKATAQWGLIPLIRIRHNAWIEHQGRRQRARTVFDTPQWRVLRKPRKVYGSMLYLSGKRLPDGDFLILYSDRYLPTMSALYAQRWSIETLFGAYKSRGFHLESCRVTDHHRLRCLLFVLAIGLMWAIQTGEWLIEQGHAIATRVVKPPVAVGDEPVADAVEQRRAVYSLFRHGLDELRDRILQQQPILYLIPLLSCH